LSSARLLILAVSIVLLLIIVRKLLSSWFGGSSREEEYRKLESSEKRENRYRSGEAPACPECGGPTEYYQYPHLRVWRCTGYPDCRGFVKARKPPRPKFATDWERKNRGPAE
jgi:ssDNA-binding Zn-finger/Zn-ribbon topoisomerase 1